MSDDINWRGVNLNLLLTFDALMELRSVTRAAEHLHIGQPAMSYNLNQLRGLLQDPLFERQGHGMAPTRRAEELAPKVRQVLSIIRNDILLTRQFDPARSTEQLTIGLSDYAELVFGPLIYDVVSQQAPNCQLIFRAIDSDNCNDSLESGLVDLTIGVYQSLPANLSRTTLYRERHICLYDHRAVGCEDAVTLEQYLRVPHAIVTANGELTTAVDATLTAMGKQRRVMLGSSRFLTLRHVLSGRRLICVMAEMMARIPVFNDQLTICDPPIPVLDFDVEMVIRRRDAHNDKIIWLQERISSIIRDYVNELKKVNELKHQDHTQCV